MTDVKDIRVLCLSFRTPPEVRPQAILVGKMIPEWMRQGLTPVIATYKKKDGKTWTIDAPVYELPRHAVLSRLGRLPFMSGVMERLYYEDLFHRVRRIIEKHGINLVYSFAKPQQSNVLAAMIRRRLGVPAIAHYSDPWIERAVALKPRDVKTMLVQERDIMESCDRVVFVAEQLRDLVMKKYPVEWMAKTRVVTHCFDPADYPAVDGRDRAKFTVSHIGVFYKNGRDPRALFEAASALLARRPELASKLVIDLVGSVSPYAEFSADELRALIARYRLEDVVRVTPPVPYRESLAAMRRSDCLIAVDFDVPRSPYTPSKVFDYAGSGRPMIGVMREDNPTAAFIRKAGYATFGHGESEALSRCLEGMIDGTRTFTADDAFIGRFSVRQTTASLIKIFQEVCR